MKEKEIIIKCFKTLRSYYFYDRYTNSVVKVSPDEYNILKRIEEEGMIPADEKCLSKYVEKGLLQKRRTIEIKHPLYDEVEYYATNRLMELILQVTQQCNLRCSYCTYSGNYYNREHSDERMSFEMAKRAMDFYFDHTGDMDDLGIAFYGGEPLLEFSLIRRCVEYAEEQVKDKSIAFYITTNGTLLTDKVISFLVKHNVRLTISLDGEKEEHDINRRFRNGKGSFDFIIKNLQKLKDCNEEYFDTVMYNTVINPRADLKSVLKYFSKSQLFNPRRVRLSMMTDSGLIDSSLLSTDESFWVPYRYELMKVLLYMANKIRHDDLHPLYAGMEYTFDQFYKELRQHSVEATVMHHGGPCVPGTRRLFVTTTGKFYPCERVSESLREMEIGSIDRGFDYEKMRAILNIGRLTEEQCLRCWNLRLCKMCASEIDPIDSKLTSKGKLPKCTQGIEKSLHDLRKICTLVESGHRLREEENNG